MARYQGRVRFANENFGESKLAEKYGVKRYPAIFVDEILIAKPNDFGFFGEGEKAGRYTPWRDAASHARFQADLARMLDLVLAGKKKEAARGASAQPVDELRALPAFQVTDLAGKPLASADLAGRVVVVEFWATWCPPCRSTLEWLGAVKKKYGDRVAVVAFAVESPEEGVRKLAAAVGGELAWAVGTPETARAFGDIAAVPALYVFDRTGKTAGTWFGAPPELHEQVERVLDRVTGGR